MEKKCTRAKSFKSFWEFSKSFSRFESILRVILEVQTFAGHIGLDFPSQSPLSSIFYFNQLCMGDLAALETRGIVQLFIPGGS